MRPLFTGLVLIAAAAIGSTGLRATPQNPQQPQPPSERGRRVVRAPAVTPSMRHDLSRPVRDITPHAPKPKRHGHPPYQMRQVREKPRQTDPALQDSFPLVAAPATLFNFEGVNNVDGLVPPDTNGDIGPNHYVQWVNTTFAVYDRSGAVLYGPAAGSTVWDGFGGPCESRNDGDPIVLYDHLADRWLLSQFALPNNFFGLLFAPFYQCIAISQTPDPTGAYYRYQYEFSKLNDYPKFGVWPDGYYMTINQFSPGSLQFAGQGVVAFNRAAMLAGQPAGMVYFDLASVDPNLGGMLPSDLDGPPPPSGSPNYFVQMDDDAFGYSVDRLQLWRFHVDWNAPANSTFTGPDALPVAPFDSNMCAFARSCIPQPGTTVKLDALADRLMYRLQYRNFGTHDSLVVNHTVDVDGTDRAGLRWYEIRNPGGTPTLYQQGTFSPDSLHRWMASAAMDSAGNLAIAYNTGGATLSPSIRYTGRLASDPLGVLGQGENDLIHGSGSQTHAASRWGDYSMLTVDPVDGCTFWATAEYYAVTSSAGWQTRIGAFRLPGCGDAGPAPDAPSGLTAVAVSDRRIDLSWTDHAANESGFSIERCAGSAAACDASGGFTRVAQTATGTTTYADTQLQASTTYSYRVRAFNAGGESSFTNTAQATTLDPPSVSVAATVATASESGPTTGVFTVSRDTPTSTALAVAFTLSGTAVRGTDYQSPALSVTIPAGAASATVSIVPIDDTTIEPAETVVLTVSASADYSVTAADSATVTIVSDDLSLDLLVSSLTAPGVTAVGGTLQATDATGNQGADTAPSSTTSFFLSANYILDTADTLLGSRVVPELTSGATHSATTPLVLPGSVTAGTYVLFAKADGLNELTETTELNNTRAATVRIGPDLAVVTLTAPTMVAAAVPFAVNEATKNQGAGLAAASATRFYLSSNYLLDAADTPLQARSVPALDGGVSSGATTMITIPAGTPSGGYYVVAKADDGHSVPEHTETNNTRFVFVNVGGDLVVSGLTAPVRVAAGSAIAVSDTTKNNGMDAVGPSVTGFYVSSNYVLDAADAKLPESRSVPSLAAGASSSAVTQVTLPTVPPGTWFLVAKADDPQAIAEPNEANNTRFATLLVGPDLTVATLTVPSTATAGTVISVSDGVKNLGAEAAGASTTRFYLSSNAILDASDILLAETRAVGPLAPNATDTGSTAVTLPSGVSGQFYLVAVADATAAVAESTETNNMTLRLITISQ